MCPWCPHRVLLIWHYVAGLVYIQYHIFGCVSKSPDLENNLKNQTGGQTASLPTTLTLCNNGWSKVSHICSDRPFALVPSTSTRRLTPLPRWRDNDLRLHSTITTVLLKTSAKHQNAMHSKTTLTCEHVLWTLIHSGVKEVLLARRLMPGPSINI